VNLVASKLDMALNTNKQFENALKEKEQDIQFLMRKRKICWKGTQNFNLK